MKKFVPSNKRGPKDGAPRTSPRRSYGYDGFSQSDSQDKPRSFGRDRAPRSSEGGSSGGFKRGYNREDARGSSGKPFQSSSRFSSRSGSTRPDSRSGPGRDARRDSKKFGSDAPRSDNSGRKFSGEKRELPRSRIDMPFKRPPRDDASRERSPSRDDRRSNERSERKPAFSKPRSEYSRDKPQSRSHSKPYGDSRERSGSKPDYQKSARPASTSQQLSKPRSGVSFSADITPHRLQGVFTLKRDICTKALTSTIVYGERHTKGYRIWDPKRSKLGAAIHKGVSQIGIKPGATVLYLGCSTGTTVSHVSDMVGELGKVYALDVAPRVMRDLVLSLKDRENVYPLMADANNPASFAHLLSEVDVVFMDIAQREQVSIFLKNVTAFLKPGGFGLLSLKSRSVDITKSPKQVFTETRQSLEAQVTIVDYAELDPFEIDHAMFVIKKN